MFYLSIFPYALTVATFDKHLLFIFHGSEGHVDPGENDLQAAFRETEEEAGLKEQDLAVIKDFESVLRVRRVYISSNITSSTDFKVFYWFSL